jgi:oligopeptide/dipeptide ABC transporter, ATP-binding protein, C-terminal domain
MGPRQEELRRVRGRDIVMIFQDPMLSLNPTFRVGSQMAEVLRSHLEGRRLEDADLRARVVDALRDGRDSRRRRPVRELPARVLRRHAPAHHHRHGPAAEARLLVADEPTSSLDVTLEAQILELLRQLRDREGTAILFVSHDLGVIAQLCDRVIVMYAGRVVEENDTVQLFDQPMHPYTRALIECLPSRLRRGGRLATIPGVVPSLSALPAGCKFADRCPYVQGLCRRDEPRLIPQDPGRVRCHMHDPAQRGAWRTRQTPAPGGRSDSAQLTDVSPGPPSRQSTVEAHLEILNLRRYFDERRGLVGRFLRARARRFARSTA